MLPLAFAVLSLFQSLPLGGIPVAGGGGGGGAVFKGESHDNQSTADTTISTPATLNVAGGDLIVVVIGATNHDTASVTCGSDTLTQAAFNTEPSNYKVYAFYKENASANSSVTCTATFNTAVSFRAIEAVNYSGVLTSSSLKNTSCNSATCNALAASSTGRTAQNITTTTANAVLIGCGLDWNGGNTLTGANGYTKRVNGESPFLFDKNVSSTGTYPSGNFATSNTADQYLSFLLVFGTQ